MSYDIYLILSCFCLLYFTDTAVFKRLVAILHFQIILSIKVFKVFFFKELGRWFCVFFLAALGLHWCVLLSLVAVSGG